MRVRELSRINEIEEGRGFSKRLIFYFFNRLQHGKLIISEQDKVIGVFGDMKSTMVAHIQVENPKFYSRVLLGGSIGAGESYVDGDWNTPNLKYVVQVFLKNYEILDEIEKKYTWLTRLSNSWTHLSRKNSILQAKKNISFRNHYLLPMISAIWSSSYNESAGFSLYFFIKFFSHHGLLSVNNRPQWYVIQKGSREYVSALMAQADFEVRLNSPVKSVRRNSDSVEVSTLDRTETYDEVIFACHSDQALKILSDASDLEKEILGALPYQENQVTLHTDISRLPKNKRNWASWNYMIEQPTDMESAQVKVSYNMNILQGIQSPKTFVVSLNQDELIDPKKILRQFKYWHPVFSKESEQYKARRDEISGVNRTYFCGAYWHSGFHEDGVVSALAVLSKLGMTL